MLIEKIVLHLMLWGDVSKITVLFMSICILIMSGVFLYHRFFHKDLFQRNMISVGIIIRVLLFMALSIEFYHHVKISSGLGTFANRDVASGQFINLLFLSYILVIGIYDILTIGIEKYHGFFHTFDMAMMGIPLVREITGLILTLVIEHELFPQYWMNVIVAGISVYLLFEMYWKRNQKSYIILFSISIVNIIFSAFLQGKFTLPLATFIFLVGLYELCRDAFRKLNLNYEFRSYNIYNYVIDALVVILIIMTNPYYNLSGFVINNKTYNIDLVYSKEVKLATYSEVEKSARKATQNYKDKFIISNGLVEDFHNLYQVYLGDYRVSINGVTGKVNDINLVNEKRKAILKDTNMIVLAEKEIVQKSLIYLKDLGFTYDSKKIDFEVNKDKDKYIVAFYHKYNDGKRVEKENRFAEITWTLNGTLEYFTIGSGIFDLKDNKQITLTEKEIEKILTDFYKNIGEDLPEYVIVNACSIFDYQEGGYSAEIVCEDDSEITINALTKEVIRFLKNGHQYNEPRESGMKNDTNEKVALQYISKFNKEFSAKSYVVEEYDKESYHFIDKQKPYSKDISITIDKYEKVLQYSNRINATRGTNYKNEFKLKPMDALKKVEKLYKKLNIYTSRVRLAVVTDKEGNYDFKWMVMVIPYLSQEHHVYFVDVNNGEIDPVAEYSRGLK